MPFSPHPVFEAPPAGQALWRYMDFPRFYFLMTRKSLYLSSLVNLTNDPWEGLPTLPHFDPNAPIIIDHHDSQEGSPVTIQQVTVMKQVEYFGDRRHFDANTMFELEMYQKAKKAVFVNCWHMSDTESEALWKIYGGSGYGICIRSTYERLEDSLSWSKPIYAGKVSYLDETKDPIGVNNFFYACMWKRRSFEHEREFRVVVRGDLNTVLPGLAIPIEVNRLTQEIIVHPEAANWFLEIVQDVAKSVACEATVRRSELLNEPNYVWPNPEGEVE